MYISIETSSAVSSLAVGNEDCLKGSLTVEAGLTHSEQLVPHIDQLLKMAKVAKNEVQGIAISIGPGSFTGLRIGLATAKAMAYVWKVPLVGIMSMDVWAQSFRTTSDLVSIMVDAQKKNVYESRYKNVNGQFIRIQEPQVKARVDALEELAARKEIVYLSGDGIISRAGKKAVADLSEGHQLRLADIGQGRPLAENLLLLAIPKFMTGDTEDAMTLLPYYIRRADAEDVWDQKHPEAQNTITPQVTVTEAAGQE